MFDCSQPGRVSLLSEITCERSVKRALFKTEPRGRFTYYHLVPEALSAVAVISGGVPRKLEWDLVE
jgi:hypothetical protein